MYHRKISERILLRNCRQIVFRHALISPQLFLQIRPHNMGNITDSGLVNTHPGTAMLPSLEAHLHSRLFYTRPFVNGARPMAARTYSAERFLPLARVIGTEPVARTLFFQHKHGME